MFLRSRRLRISLLAALVPVLAGVAALATRNSALAEEGKIDNAEQAQRCGVRLSMALLGASPDAALLASSAPQSQVDAILKTPAFTERFVSFINSELAGTPNEDASKESIYYLTKYVLENNKPWSDLFIGPYGVTPTATGMAVSNDPKGVGYFRSQTWQRRYAGNDEEGTMLVASFRIVQNTTGLTLTPSVGNAGEDRGLEGRKAPACKTCHFEAWYALDTVAKLLPKRQGTGDKMTFTPPTAGPQPLLGKTIADDKQFIETLVASDAWRFNQCRRVFKFLYGRTENQCESKVFDACVDALVSTKDIRASVAVVAKDPTFCSN